MNRFGCACGTATVVESDDLDIVLAAAQAHRTECRRAAL